MQKKNNILLALVVVLNILESKKPANHAEKMSAILLVLVVVLNILETRSQQTMQKKTHFVSASCRAQYPGKQEASKPCRKNNFVSASCRAQHLGKQEASKPCREKRRISLALVVVLNILENNKPTNHVEKISPILLLTKVPRYLDTTYWALTSRPRPSPSQGPAAAPEPAPGHRAGPGNFSEFK